MKLFMIMLGCKPEGRKTEQHDIFFGIGETLRSLVEQIKQSWEDAGKIHIDAWREVTTVGGYSVEVVPRHIVTAEREQDLKLFFVNLGGYKKNEFDEFHYKILIAAPDKSEAISQAKASAFYSHTGFKGAASHVDDRYGVDVDDVYGISEILSKKDKATYRLKISSVESSNEDEIHLGYFILDKL